MTKLVPFACSRIPLLAVALATVWGVRIADAEPIFLSKQYTRCTACHYSPTGGGLLTPYGRSLSAEEISMLGGQSDDEADAEDGSAGEEAFLGGVLGDVLGPVQLGLELRPSHLEVESGGRSFADRNFFMNLDVIAAYQSDRWTLYGEVGRQPTADGGTFDSYEHWVGYRLNDGVQIRAGRFLPAYGVRFADHTSFSRSLLGLAQYDQIYGVEVGFSNERSLVQVSVGPGRADSIVDDDGRQAFAISGRAQFDLSPRTVVVGSVMHRNASDRQPRSTDTGVSFGFAPTRRVTTWTQLDLRDQDRLNSDRTYIFANQTSLEVIRGLWVRLSPQVRWSDRDPLLEVRRLVLGADFYPRTHWHVNLSYYRDRAPFLELPTRIVLAQLHLYL